LFKKREYVSRLPRKESPQKRLELSSQDLEAIRKSVEDAATVGAGLWLSYLFLMFYFAVAAGAITHVDLLLENAVKLPFLNVELPLLGFFSVAPVLFIVVHTYTLVHFVLLGRKASLFHERLYSLFPKAADGSAVDVRNKVVREGLRAQLPSNVFVQLLAGPSDIRANSFGLLLRVISFCTLAIAPILVLLLFQVQFLPYHDAYVTWISRISILVDVSLLWWLWPKISSRRPAPTGAHLKIRAFSAAAASSLLVLTFSFSVASFPGERADASLPTVNIIPTAWKPPSLSTLSSWQAFSRWIDSLSLVSVHKLLFAGPIDDVTRRRSSLFSNTLVLTNFDVYNALKIDDPNKIGWKDRILTLRGRHLEGAIFDDAKLLKTDLSFAFLEHASFSGAIMPGVDLRGAHLDGASLLTTNLKGADLTSANLLGASIVLSHFEGASLLSANLIGAAVVESYFSGAILDDADFRGAIDQLADNDNVGPNFTGASLKQTDFQGALLINTNFGAADLSGAYFWRSDLDGSKFDSALCSDVVLSATAGLDKDGKQAPWTPDMFKGLVEGTETDSRFEDIKMSVRQNLKVLDCESTNQDPFIPPCGERAKESKATKVYAEVFRKSCFPKEQDHDRVVLTQLQNLVCNGDEDSIYVLRSLLKYRDVVTGKEFEPPSQRAAEFMSFVLSKSCPVSSALSDSDRGELEYLRSWSSSERNR
jgi:uncharacterized protein YjbI with pentapeptide repeats